MYQVRVGEDQQGPFEGFAEAFKVFFEGVIRMVEEGTSWQVLETYCWVEFTGEIRGGSIRFPIMWYDARDLGYDLGLLQGEGKLVDPLPEIDENDVHTRILELITKEADAALTQVKKLTAQALDQLNELEQLVHRSR